MNKKISAFLTKNKSPIFIVILVALLLYLFLPDLETIKESLELIKGADLFWILIAIILFFLTIPLNAMQLRVVCYIKVKFWLTFKVQMAHQFIGKLLPSSISAFVINSFYLHAIGHTPSQTAAVIAIKAVSSSIAFMLLCLIVILFSINSLGGLNLSENIKTGDFTFGPLLLIIGIGGISLFWVLLKLQKTREFINKTVGNFWNQFKFYKNRPWDVFFAILYSFILTSFQAATLLACSYALGLDISFTQVFVIFTLGNTVAMLVPTPGGVGAAEAGLYAGFTLMGFPESESLAVVTLYRLITFYLPIIPGFIFFVNLRKDLLKNFSINKNFIKKSKVTKASIA